MQYYHGMFALLYKPFWMFESMIYKKKCFVWQTGFLMCNESILQIRLSTSLLVTALELFWQSCLDFYEN